MSYKWAKRTLEFHAKNPHVYTELERITNEVIDAGIYHIGMEMIIGQLRWRSLIHTTGDIYKINQNFATYYARLLIRNNPDWDGLFRFKDDVDWISVILDGEPEAA